jgi:stalled ribosome rescue protein Dom34
MSDNRDDALIWIDHRQAKVFLFNGADFDSTQVRTAHPDRHIRPQAGEGGKAALDEPFFKRVAQAVAQAGAILVTGHAEARTELVAYIKRAQPELAVRICGVESLDTPTDRALTSLARTFFGADVAMYSQSRR